MEYKKQHYVPASYLQYFGEVNKGRNTEIYLSTDSKSWFKKKVGDVCGSNDFYSSEYREESEQFLGRTFEGGYSEIVERIINGEELPIQKAYDLLRYKVHLYCRSPACDIRDEGERILYFQSAFTALMFEMANSPTVKSETDAAQFIANAFHSTVVYFKESIFNSDNPVIIYRSDLGYYLLACLVTPNHLSIHADKRGFVYNRLCGEKKANAIMADIVRNRIRFIIYPSDLRGVSSDWDGYELDKAMGNNMVLTKKKMTNKSIVYDDRFPIYTELKI